MFECRCNVYIYIYTHIPSGVISHMAGWKQWTVEMGDGPHLASVRGVSSQQGLMTPEGDSPGQAPCIYVCIICVYRYI